VRVLTFIRMLQIQNRELLVGDVLVLVSFCIYKQARSPRRLVKCHDAMRLLFRRTLLSFTGAVSIRSHVLIWPYAARPHAQPVMLMT